MDEFDRLLELHLRRKLDAVVAALVPVRRGRAGSAGPQRERNEATTTKMGGAAIQLWPDALVFIEHS
jgi:hypothetical protein